ncbi:MAG: DUF6916 family protein [Gammaproteobacteria bacterium]
MLESLTKEHWPIYLGDRFRVDIAESGEMELQLYEVSGFSRQKETGREAYSLLFSGPMNPVLQQGIFTIRHNAMGLLDIFLVPIGPDSKGMRYEAIFN